MFPINCDRISPNNLVEGEPRWMRNWDQVGWLANKWSLPNSLRIEIRRGLKVGVG